MPRAVLARDASPDLVAAATRLAAAGYTVRRHEAAEEADLRPHFEPESALTQREMQVLGLLADGASNKVIARKLDISVHTAKFHVASVTAKLRARNRTDAISIALREGVLVA
jgi:DNA-binding NarL/FixJ family response regulator